jgi:hypothetical protein
VLQVDGYTCFGAVVKERVDDQVTLAFCWTHARRYFFEFHASTQSPIAAEALARIARLYAIEVEIRGQPAATRQAVRHAKSRPLIEAVHEWLNAQLPRISKGSDLAKAMRYTLRHWVGLTLFLDDGRIELDTNTVEREIRRIPLGRNYVRSRIMLSSCWRRPIRPNVASTFSRRRHGHNSEALEEARQLIRRPITRVRGFDRLQSGEGALLHREVRLQIHVRRRRTLVIEPEGDHRDVDSGLKHVHRGAVADRVRRYRAAGVPGLVRRGADNRKGHALCDVRARYSPVGN